MHLRPKDANEVLQIILDADPVVGSQSSDVEYSKAGFPKGFVENIFDYIKDQKPKFIEVNKEYNYGYIANIILKRRSEVKKFLLHGGFEAQSQLSKPEFKVLKLYEANESISWSHLRDNLGKRIDLLSLSPENLGAINQKLKHYDLIADMHVTGDLTCQITEKGRDAIFIHEQQPDSYQIADVAPNVQIHAANGSMVFHGSQVGTPSVHSAQNSITNNVTGNHNPINVAAGHNVNQQGISIDYWEKKFEKLKSLGVEESEIEELKSLVASNSNKSDNKPKILSWFGRVSGALSLKDMAQNILAVSEFIHGFL